MARFMLIHSMPAHATQEQLFEGARKVSASLPPEVKWLNSWWISGEVQKLICEWEAPDADAVRAILGPISDLIPIESFYEVQWIDPRWYKQDA
jgi:hypothetical protein